MLTYILILKKLSGLIVFRGLTGGGAWEVKVLGVICISFSVVKATPANRGYSYSTAGPSQRDVTEQQIGGGAVLR